VGIAEGAAKGGAMIAMEEAAPATLALALEDLNVACTDLDAAMLALPDLRGDDVMASSNLVGLLFRVVAARRHVKHLKRDVDAAFAGALPATLFS
jgi:hypothetical protein